METVSESMPQVREEVRLGAGGGGGVVLEVSALQVCLVVRGDWERGAENRNFHQKNSAELSSAER